MEPHQDSEGPSAECPSDSSLAQLIERSLAPPAKSAMEAHIGSCAQCQDVFLYLEKWFDSRPVLSRTDTPEDPTRPGNYLPRGTSVGRYVVLDLIGVGGMGMVYSAYDPELHRKIALKIIKLVQAPSVKERALEARLVREARVMARLAHPNVIAVHDVGTFGEQVFLAMEHVAGQTLRRWLEESTPSFDEIVLALHSAGRGLAAAHAAGIIHRDFKPDNVMVSEDGRVRVMDFGLARPPSSERQENSPEQPTNPGAISSIASETAPQAGTPQYMAPEQHWGQAASARSDQFSFCLVLNESLGLKRAGARAPRWLRQILRRGLASDPEARYPSMDALLTDLARDRFKQRRIAALAVCAVALTCASVAVGQRFQVHPGTRCSGGNRLMSDVWNGPAKDRIRESFGRTNLVNASEVFGRVERHLEEYAHDWSSMHEEACQATRNRGEQSEDTLSLRNLCLERRRGELKALVGVLGMADRAVVEEAVRAASALTPLSGCADPEVLAAVKSPADPAMASAVAALRGELAETKALFDTGQYSASAKRAMGAVERARKLTNRPIQAEADSLLGEIQSHGHEQAAKQTLLDALWAAEASHDDERVAQSAVLLIQSALDSEGPKAGRFWRDFAAAAIERLKEPGLIRARFLRSEGNLLWEEGRPEDSLARRQMELTVEERLAGRESPATVVTLSEIGVDLNEQGKPEMGLPYLQRALGIGEKAYGSRHPEVGRLHTRLGYGYDNQERYQEALEEFARGRAILEATEGRETNSFAASLEGTAVVLAKQRKWNEALILYKQALDIERRIWRPDHPAIGLNLMNTALLFVEHKEFDAAVDYSQRALAILETPQKKDSLDVAFCLRGLGEAEWGRRRPHRAARALGRALAILEGHDGEEDVKAEVRFALAQAVWATKEDPARAHRLAVSARARYAALGSLADKERAEIDRWVANHPD